MEWAQYGIRVNSVSPGLVKTAMTYWVEQQPDWDQQLKYYGGIPRLAGESCHDGQAGPGEADT